MKNQIFILAIFSLASIANAQNVAINATGAAPAASAMLDISSTTSGLLIPRMTSAQRTAIAAPATGLKVYDTSTNTHWYFNGTVWVEMLGSNTGWQITGNALTTAGIFGSTTAQDVRHFSNNTEWMRLTSTGRFGFYNTAPSTWLHFTPTTLISTFQTMWDNALTGDALARWQHTSTVNGSRVVLSVTNYNANAFQAAALMGLSIQTAGTGGVGVQGVCNGSGQTGVFAANQNPTGSTGGWGLYSNNWAGGVTAWQNVSDGRLKKDIVRISDPISKIKNLRGVEYYFDTEKYNDINLPDNKQYGFIAQEVEQVMPEIVRESLIYGNQNKKADSNQQTELKTYQLKTLSYTNIIPLLIEGMKAQQEKIEALEKEINELKKK